MTLLNRIQDFLGHKRFALVGVSQKPQDFSRTLLREFQHHGYDVVPVNPAATEIDGRPCFAHVQDIQPPVSAVLLMTSPPVTETVVRDCAAARVQEVWMYRASGKGAVSANAIAFCESHGIAVIPGECPLMFLPHTGWFHRFHAWMKRINGSYPK